MTNKEWLQSASTERLSEFLLGYIGCEECVKMHNGQKPCMKMSCLDGWKDWLAKEAYEW